MKVGIIGDTHGALAPSIPELFAGVDRIVHAGDVGSIAVLRSLERIAPVTAVRGNYDSSPDLAPLLWPDPSRLRLAGIEVLLTHRLISMDWNQHRGLIAAMVARTAPGVGLFIFGHTHVPVLERVGGIWFVNPGYAGPDPLEGPTTVARIELGPQGVSGEIVELPAAR